MSSALFNITYIVLLVDGCILVDDPLVDVNANSLQGVCAAYAWQRQTGVWSGGWQGGEGVEGGLRNVWSWQWAFPGIPALPVPQGRSSVKRLKPSPAQAVLRKQTMCVKKIKWGTIWLKLFLTKPIWQSERFLTIPCILLQLYSHGRTRPWSRNFRDPSTTMHISHCFNGLIEEQVGFSWFPVFLQMFAKVNFLDNWINCGRNQMFMISCFTTNVFASFIFACSGFPLDNINTICLICFC